MKTEPTEKEKIIKGLEIKIRNCDGGLDEVSWSYEEGILISKRDAIDLVELLKYSPKIKQLEWEEPIIDEDGSEWIESHYIFGQFYEIEGCPNGSFILYKVDCSETTHSSLDEAKVAAQRDFEKRIKECLE
jgi:hypothetical protein